MKIPFFIKIFKICRLQFHSTLFLFLDHLKKDLEDKDKLNEELADLLAKKSEELAKLEDDVKKQLKEKPEKEDQVRKLIDEILKFIDGDLLKLVQRIKDELDLADPKLKELNDQVMK